MQKEIIYKIKSDSNSIKYLRENSYWYKYLNRDPKYIKEFESKMKEKYKLRPEDKLNKIVEGLDMMSRIMDILN